MRDDDDDYEIPPVVIKPMLAPGDPPQFEEALRIQEARAPVSCPESISGTVVASMVAQEVSVVVCITLPGSGRSALYMLPHQ